MTRRPPRTYVVRVPVRGYATYLVEADTAVHAAAMVDAYDLSAECIATEVERSGKSKAWLDAPAQPVIPARNDATR